MRPVLVLLVLLLASSAQARELVTLEPALVLETRGCSTVDPINTGILIESCWGTMLGRFGLLARPAGPLVLRVDVEGGVRGTNNFIPIHQFTGPNPSEDQPASWGLVELRLGAGVELSPLDWITIRPTGGIHAAAVGWTPRTLERLDDAGLFVATTADLDVGGWWELNALFGRGRMRTGPIIGMEIERTAHRVFNDGLTERTIEAERASTTTDIELVQGFRAAIGRDPVAFLVEFLARTGWSTRTEAEAQNLEDLRLMPPGSVDRTTTWDPEVRLMLGLQLRLGAAPDAP